MNTLTVNLHLLLALVLPPDGGALPDPDRGHGVPVRLVRGAEPGGLARPRPGRRRRAGADRRRGRGGDRAAGGSLAVALLPGVNYLNGEVARRGRPHGGGARGRRRRGWDLAHAIGNVPVSLHDADADFAVWCHYKYVNGGPGAPGGAFVHERHGATRAAAARRLVGERPRDPLPHGARVRAAARAPRAGRSRRRPVLALAPLRASLEQFDRVGMDPLRAALAPPHRLPRGAPRRGRERRGAMAVMTPRDPERARLPALRLLRGARSLAARLRSEHGVVCDFREPDVLRFAPVPLYNTYEDCRRAAAALLDALEPR